MVWYGGFIRRKPSKCLSTAIVFPEVSSRRVSHQERHETERNEHCTYTLTLTWLDKVHCVT
jgi:hypothetical protein